MFFLLYKNRRFAQTNMKKVRKDAKNVLTFENMNNTLLGYRDVVSYELEKW